jgi:hypothetical protein
MQVWVVTTKEKNKIVGIYSDIDYANKNIKNPENVNIIKFQVNATLKKG